jgi:2-(1,2-epoxy-1,2-dihydrophenyl)acetyl-CoA isomerase
MAPLVRCEVADGVATITLNRPEKGNALSTALGKQLREAACDLASQKSVRAVLLTGGGKTFCVGGDISEMQEGPDLESYMKAAVPPLHAAIRALANLQVPVVAALNGAVAGAGIGLALCADLVLAGESMKLRSGYSAIGLTPDLGAAYFLAVRAGAARAKEIMFLNRTLTAAECLEWGIVNAVHPDALLQAEAQQLAKQLSGSASLSLGRIKHLVNAASRSLLEDHLALEQTYMVTTASSHDAREGVAAFLEKRPPSFCGQ